MSDGVPQGGAGQDEADNIDAGLTAAWARLNYHEGQMRAFTSRARFVAIPAGRGSGKTELARRKLVLSLADPKPWSDPRYFFASDTTAHARAIAWDSILALIPPHWIASKRESFDSMYIRTIFGSTLHFFGLFAGTKRSLPVEGRQWDGGVIDESSDCPPGVFDRSIVPALTWRSGWCWRIGVPKRQGVGAPEFRAYYERAVAGQIPEAEGYSWPSSDIVPPETLAYARATLDPKDYREQFEACWETAGGGIFWAFDRERNVRHCPYKPDALLSVSCDWNVDPMAWVIGHRYADRVEWIDEIWLRDSSTRAALDVLWDRYSSHRGGWEFFGDATSRSRHTSASFSDYALLANDRRFASAPGGRRIYIPRANPPIADRFAACNAMFCNADGQRRMFVSPGCTHLIDDLQARHYKPGSSEPADTGDLGHITDAMGYLVWRCFPIRIQVAQPSPRVILTKGGRRSRPASAERRGHGRK